MKAHVDEAAAAGKEAEVQSKMLAIFAKGD
jgi:hypothetical protein